MKFKDLVKETTTTAGTGGFVRAGAVAGFRAFTPAYTVGDLVPYFARMGAQWEAGEGTLTSTTIERTRVIDSSNNGGLVDFTAGTKELYVSLHADFLNGVEAANLPLAGTLSGGDFIPIVQNGVEVRTTLTAIAAAVASINGNAAPPADTTPPTLTSASGTATGVTTGSGSVTTNEANGTLYYLASTASTATAAAVKAGSALAVTSTGAKAVSLTGLTASTAYCLHFLHRDAAGNDSAVLSSASFTTQAATTPVTGISLTGPSGGNVSAASSNFTAGVTPIGGTIASPITVTPSDGGAGGTFSPVTVQLTSAAPTATFTYTPSATAGAKSITVTNSAALTNPAAITYTAISAPAAPTIGTATAGTESATVGFTAPASDGGSAITGYTITTYRASDNGVVGTTQSASIPANVTGLTAGVVVYFKVAAVNSVGTGPQSAASANVTPTAAAALSYATWSTTDKNAGITLSGGDLSATHGPSGAWLAIRATAGKSSGKWYWELKFSNISSVCVGIGTSGASLANFPGSADGLGRGYFITGSKFSTGGSGVAYGAAYTATDTIGVALDMTAGTIEFFKNGVSQGVAFTGLSGTYFPMVGINNASGVVIANFGASAFTYTPPAGFNAGVTA